MARQARLVRRVTAGPVGWAGDPAWSEASPPTPVEAPDVEEGEPVFHIPARHPVDTHRRSRGVAGMVRVLGEPDRRFELRLYQEWVRDGVSDWRLLGDGDEPREIGDGEDFTTDPAYLSDARIAFRLTPLDDVLAEGSSVEIWVEVL